MQKNIYLTIEMKRRRRSYRENVRLAWGHKVCVCVSEKRRASKRNTHASQYIRVPHFTCILKAFETETAHRMCVEYTCSRKDQVGKKTHQCYSKNAEKLFLTAHHQFIFISNAVCRHEFYTLWHIFKFGNEFLKWKKRTALMIAMQNAFDSRCV